MGTSKKGTPIVWRSHVRNLFDEIIQCNDNTKILHKPLQITINMLAEIAEYAAEINDEKLIDFCSRLALYHFSDPENKKEYNEKRTDYYIKKTKEKTGRHIYDALLKERDELKKQNEELLAELKWYNAPLSDTLKNKYNKQLSL